VYKCPSFSENPLCLVLSKCGRIEFVVGILSPGREKLF
jgi:hypothetical protein